MTKGSLDRDLLIQTVLDHKIIVTIHDGVLCSCGDWDGCARGPRAGKAYANHLADQIMPLFSKTDEESE